LKASLANVQSSSIEVVFSGGCLPLSSSSIFLNFFNLKIALLDYFQSHPQFQPSWAKLALFFILPAVRLPIHPPTHPPELVLKKQEISSTCFGAFEGLIK
jgi:hypothetical protein